MKMDDPFSHHSAPQKKQRKAGPLSLHPNGLVRVGDTVAVFADQVYSGETVADYRIVLNQTTNSHQEFLVFLPRHGSYGVFKESSLLSCGRSKRAPFAQLFLRSSGAHQCTGAYRRPGHKKIAFEISHAETETPKFNFTCHIGNDRTSIEQELLSIVPKCFDLSHTNCLKLLRKYLGVKYWTIQK